MSLYKMDVRARVLIVALGVFELLGGIVMLTLTLLRIYVSADLAVLLGLVVGVFALITGALNIIMAHRTSFIIYPDRLAFQSLGFTVEAPWDDVQISRADNNSKNAESLLLSNPTVHTAFWRPRWTIVGFNKGIPLASFSDAWKSGTLRTEIQEYVLQSLDHTGE